jgi:hypothetical protein
VALTDTLTTRDALRKATLEDSLYSYSQADPALVEVVSVVGEPVTYHLTDDGTALVDASRPNLLGQIPLYDEGADGPGDEPNGAP